MTDPEEQPADGREDVRPARWFHLQGERQYGPLDLETMRGLVIDRVVTPDTYVWADGMPDWMRAGDVPALVPPDADPGRGFVGPDPVE